MSLYVDNIMRTINWKELRLRNFNFIQVDESTLRVQKGKSSMTIHYNIGLDLYEIRYYKWQFRNGDIKVIRDEVIRRIYGEQLQELLQEFFNFEYTLLLVWK